MTLVLLKALCL